jgi:ABC-type transporter Mla subunit MlaD
MNEVTQEEFQKFRRAVIKKLAQHDALISDAFQAIAELGEKEDNLVDEALERATRAQRAVRRLERRMKELEDAAE